MRLVDPATGEAFGALVPIYAADREALRTRRYTVGSELRAEITKKRDAWKHRFVHALGTYVQNNVEGFEQGDAHDVVKRLQRECGVQCEEQEIDFPGVGRVVVKVARSIAYDSMEDGDFSELALGICRHLSTVYLKTLTPEQVNEAVEMMARIGE